MSLNYDAKINPAESLIFKLPPVMTIETIENLVSEIKQLPLSDKTSLTLDASNVENISTPGLQLIISLEKTFAARNGALIINGQKDFFLRALEDVGLDSLLNKIL
ncbi:MAG: STAS domain-containing protein [Rickettsiales bacterium]|jgi:anti-anti-sigma regulatory factor